MAIPDILNVENKESWIEERIRTFKEAHEEYAEAIDDLRVRQALNLLGGIAFERRRYVNAVSYTHLTLPTTPYV